MPENLSKRILTEKNPPGFPRRIPSGRADPIRARTVLGCTSFPEYRGHNSKKRGIIQRNCLFSRRRGAAVFSSIWWEDLLRGRTLVAENEQKGLFPDRHPLNVCISPSAKKYAFQGASVVTTLPDTLFMEFFQEFSIEQGVDGSKSRLVLGFVLEFGGNGGWSGAGLGG